ncbi:MAG: 6-bladed beta-propeller [Candidatus Aminicenantales bacterium]
MPKFNRGLAFGPLFLMLVCAAASAQALIENPAAAKAKNAGRAVAAREVLVISDEGRGDFFFQWPHNLKVAPDGSLLIQDKDQLLQFDKNGKFLRNLFKKGQGPGEMISVVTCLFDEKHVIVQAGMPGKLLWIDAAGTCDREVPIRTKTPFLTALLVHGGVFYMHSATFPRVEGEPGIVDAPQNIVAFNASTGETKTLRSFPARQFVVTSPKGGGGMFDISKLIAISFQGTHLVLTHTCEYLLKLYDPASDTVLREFRRAYKRIKSPPLTEEQKKGGLSIDGKHYTQPQLTYANDVINLFAHGDMIWAVTSTRDREKGVVVDVFDADGTYTDAFYLQLPEAALRNIGYPEMCALGDDGLWIIEPSKDGTYAVRKYQIRE